MIDLSNKTNEDINAIIQKYQKIVEVIYMKYPNEFPYLITAIDLGVNYVNTKYNEIDPLWKTMCMLLIKIKYRDVNSETDINNIIDEFITHITNEYTQYSAAIELSASEYDLCYQFVCQYINDSKRLITT